MAEERSSGWAIVSFVLGALFGASLALILTPSTGQEMRERLKEMAEKAIEAAKEKLEKAQKEQGESEEALG